MPSKALAAWQGVRSRRLDNLLAAHAAMAGPGPGRKWLTSEVNHALIVRLASEFQGYCRDLHDEATSALLAPRIANTDPLTPLLRAALLHRRKLDSGNPNWGNLCEDFGRLGLELKSALTSIFPAEYRVWTQTLERLTEARNAIAHDDQAKLSAAHAVEPLTKRTAIKWRATISTHAAAMDGAVGAYLTQLNGTSPW